MNSNTALVLILIIFCFVVIALNFADLYSKNVERKVLLECVKLHTPDECNKMFDKRLIQNLLNP